MIRHCALILLCSLLVGAAAAQVTNNSTFENPEFRRLSSDLREARHAFVNGVSATEAMASINPQAVHGDQVQIMIGVEGELDDVVSAAEAAGLTILSATDNFGVDSVSALLDNPLQLDMLLQEISVGTIRSEPLAGTWAGSVPGQGDLALHSDFARTNHGVDGTGIRVGVLSDSIFDTRAGVVTPPASFPANVAGTLDQLSGDLPASLRVIDPYADGLFGGTGSDPYASDEGNGMAQLVYDVAPGCDISFASAFSSYAGFASNITALATDPGYECDIICDDVFYYAEPMYQDGPIALAYEGAYALGIPGFSSAGNSADTAQERPFVDSNATDTATIWPATPDALDFHDWDPAILSTDTHWQVTVQDLETLTVTLHWDDAYDSSGGLGAGPGATADLDLYIVDNPTWPAAGNILGPFGASRDAQGTTLVPNGDPVEVAQYYNTTGSPVTAYVVVDNANISRDPLTIHTWISGGSIDEAYDGARTIFGHSAAANVMSVAASFWIEITGDSGIGLLPGNMDAPYGGQIDVESFSALGGNLPFLFDGTGAPFVTNRLKPEITAPDGTNTTFFGQYIVFGVPGAIQGEDDAYPNFFGTSAAAPHAAAVAALMLDRASDFGASITPAQIYGIMRSTATDISAMGLNLATGDYYAGDGLINADAAVGDPGLPVELSVFSVE